MDKVEVLRILTGLDDTGPIAEVHFDMAELDERAETIAAQYEQEVAKLKGQLSERRTICEAAQEEAERNFVDLKLAQDDVAQRRAQVAVIGTVLRHIKTEWWDKHYPEDVFVGGPDSDDGVNELVAIREMIDNALSAAPKVVYFGKAKTFTFEDGKNLAVVQNYSWDAGGNVIQARDKEGYEHTMGKAGDVIILECPPEGEQGYKRARGVISLGGKRPEDVIAEMRGRPTESEQRSRRHEQSQKSEQEATDG